MSFEKCDRNNYRHDGKCDGDHVVEEDDDGTHHVSLDHMGSMTMCSLSPDGSGIKISCTTHPFDEANFATGAYKTPQEYRMLDLRLYGPSGDHVSWDLEPEGGAFTADGNTFVVNFQDNNGYAIFDVSAGKYTYMAGYGSEAMSMDASDKDDMVNIKSGWGSAPSTPSYGMYMPDQIASFKVDNTDYIILANEGGTRDGEDLIGIKGDFEGEELRFGKFENPTCTNGCESDTGFGRLLTTPFMPSDFAINACGTNLCKAWQLDYANGETPSDASEAFSCIYYRADYGGKKDATGNTAHSDCNYADMIGIYVDKINKTNETPRRPTSGYFPGQGTRGASDTSMVITAAYEFPGWFTGPTGADASITGPKECQAKCAATPTCDHFTYEFEGGYHECFLKKSHTVSGNPAHCHLYHPYVQHFKWYNGEAGSGKDWEGYSGPAMCSGTAAITTERSNANGGHGSPGGATSVGTRSFTIFSWAGGSAPLVRVYDSGNEFEVKQAMVNGGLCDACMNEAGENCDAKCPFNSDESPPKLDDRSDAKGPEPECVTTGVMSDGKILAFVGLERVGGIMVYDVSVPTAPVFQDFLNVRNWMTSTADKADIDAAEDTDALYVQKALNDGPESLVFISAADSPIGTELLLAATPLAGRLTAYALTKEAAEATLRGNDGSCKDTATCPYISVADGGSGTIRDNMDICNWCSACTTAQKEAFGCINAYTFTIVAAGTVEEYDGAKMDAIKSSIASKAGVSVSQVTLSITAASVNIKATIKAASSNELATIQAAVDPLLADAESATTLMGGSSVLTVESVSSKPIAAPPPSPAPALPPILTTDNDNSLPPWGIGIVVVCATFAILFCIVFFVMCTKERAGKPIFRPMTEMSSPAP